VHAAVPVVQSDLGDLSHASSQGGLRRPATKRPHEVLLVGEPLEIVQRAWANRRPDCDSLFHVDGKPLGPMLSELKRTCETLGIPYGRGKGIVFHDTRHTAVTNLVAAGTGEAVAMTITGHEDPSVFKRYNVRRDDVQADALARQQSYLAGKRGTTPTPMDLTQREGTTLGHDGRHAFRTVSTQA